MKLQVIALTLYLGFVSTMAHSLTFDVTYDASVANAPSGFKTDFQDALNFYQKTFANPITININVGWGEVGGTTIGSHALGESKHQGISESYSTVSSLLNKINPTYVLPAANQICHAPPNSPHNRAVYIIGLM